jgi:3-hydroxyacyl-[acyl-carrier-protein] dehydratase
MRYLLLDRILALEPGRQLRAVKNVAMSEDIFAFHFPGFPVLPGAFIVEAFSEASTLLLAATAGERAAPVLRQVRNAKFRRFVQPGARIAIEVRLTGPTATRCVATVDDREIARADLEFFGGASPPEDKRPEQLAALTSLLTGMR